jgi:succinate dehydrogenase / fumarate reductase flavoprotein subunit
MGRFAGERILAYMDTISDKVPEVRSTMSEARFGFYFNAKGRDNLGKIRDALRTTMMEKVGVFRTDKRISEAIETIKELKERTDHTSLSEKSLIMNPELIQRWELDNLLAVSMVIAQAALDRKESRGAHYREDFPERLEAFNDHTLISMPEFNRTETGKRPVDMSIFDAREPHYENFGMIQRKY